MIQIIIGSAFGSVIGLFAIGGLIELAERVKKEKQLRARAAKKAAVR